VAYRDTVAGVYQLVVVTSGGLWQADQQPSAYQACHEHYIEDHPLYYGLSQWEMMMSCCVVLPKLLIQLYPSKPVIDLVKFYRGFFKSYFVI
jgi:hypothetical protein